MTCLLQALAEIDIGLYVTPRTNGSYDDLQLSRTSSNLVFAVHRTNGPCIARRAAAEKNLRHQTNRRTHVTTDVHGRSGGREAAMPPRLQRTVRTSFPARGSGRSNALFFGPDGLGVLHRGLDAFFLG